MHKNKKIKNIRDGNNRTDYPASSAFAQFKQLLRANRSNLITITRSRSNELER